MSKIQSRHVASLHFAQNEHQPSLPARRRKRDNKKRELTMTEPTTTTTTTSADTSTTIRDPHEDIPIETATWTRYLPEAFGIRKVVQQSPYRWCTRESLMWGIATGTAMHFHRLRMGSTPHFAGNIAFGTMLLVSVPSYYFCVKKRDYKERWIELMMKANDVSTAEQMPPQPKENPFFGPDGKLVGDKEYYGHIKEQKEWQQQTPTQDAQDVFTEVPKKDT